MNSKFMYNATGKKGFLLAWVEKRHQPICHRMCRLPAQRRGKFKTSWTIHLNRQKTSMMSCAWALLNKNKYILMMLDQFSHFCTVVPIPNKFAKTVSTAILTHWIALYGTPTKIRIDAGLDSTIISMMSSLNVKKLMGRMIGKKFTHCDSCI